MVGINDYKSLTPLRNAVTDADEVEKELRRVDVKRIIRASDCTIEELVNKINQFLSKLRKGDVALVYLAAHAVMYRNQHVFLTTTTTEENVADTSLRVELLLARLIA